MAKAPLGVNLATGRKTNAANRSIDRSALDPRHPTSTLLHHTPQTASPARRWRGWVFQKKNIAVGKATFHFSMPSGAGTGNQWVGAGMEVRRPPNDGAMSW
jgi:hypothetical protein